ncbi:MAG: VOC family protein [Tetrasphaera sp.]
MADHDIRMIIMSTDDLDASIAFYTGALGFPLKFRDGDHSAVNFVVGRWPAGGQAVGACWSSVSRPSIGDHLEGFRRAPEFAHFLSLVAPFIDQIEEMQHYE